MSSLFYALTEKIRKNKPVPAPVAAVLSAATVGVRLGMWLRLRARPVKVDARVISFGNITAGGTGKTPAVIERACAELEAGHRVAVLTRGYGTRQGREPVVVDTAREDNAQSARLYEFVGDEPALIARRCPGVVIVKCPDRVEGALLAIDQFGCDTLILDDGFQHVRLARDENVCVIDALNPFGNGRLMPRGILREEIEAIRRATHICLTRCDVAGDIQPLLRELKALHPDAPVRTTRHAATLLWRVSDGARVELAVLREQRIAAACAVAAPETFFATLRGLGAEVERQRSFPDHAPLPADAVSGFDYVVVTEKDAVKMSNPPSNVYALGIELREFE